MESNFEISIRKQLVIVGNKKAGLMERLNAAKTLADILKTDDSVTEWFRVNNC
tara:strand:+ start:10396 stop:10554 length:159 start_codon:yes stop_codon:yes gene_type:complete